MGVKGTTKNITQKSRQPDYVTILPKYLTEVLCSYGSMIFNSTVDEKKNTQYVFAVNVL